MFEALGLLLNHPGALLGMLIAIPAGLAFGAVPGLGGKIALIAVMPFLFVMDAVLGRSF